VVYLLRAAFNMLMGRDYLMGGVLRPAPARIEQYRKNLVASGRVLDMGTGSGVLAKLAFEKGAREVVAADINPSAVLEAKKNVPDATVIKSDLFDSIEGRFDSIIFAAPWSEGKITDVSLHAVYDNGVMGRFFRDAKDHLAKGAHLWVQYSDASPTNFESFHRVLGENGYSIVGSWNYGTWDILAGKKAGVYLYKIRPFPSFDPGRLL
jgi:methylase of polypeptide subunit release factors